MRRLLAGAAGALLLVSGLSGAVQAQGTDDLAGVWRNPKNTVHVRIAPCGPNVCGTIVWASEQAQTKAAEAGNPKLLGTQIFREFKPQGPNAWKGRVFVPDMDRTFSGNLKLASQNAVVARGCVLGFICKSQTWIRVR